MPDLIRTLRRNALQARREMSDDARATASQIICRSVCDSREFYSSKSIACYLPMPDEVDTREIIERAWCANKRVFVPILRSSMEMLFCRIDPESELEKNFFGLWEPTRGVLIEPRQLYLVVTPTVAFDSERNRIGMGGGYYDRCFSFLRHRKNWIRPKLVGVAFQCQEVEKITPNPWDIRLYRAISDKK
jgi:5-formyltetrahydrofolate cyclo-ligase